MMVESVTVLLRAVGSHGVEPHGPKNITPAGVSQTEDLADRVRAARATAVRSYVSAIEQYPGPLSGRAATKDGRTTALTHWLAGHDPAGREIGTVDVPTLVADGTVDQLNPAANDRLDTASIPHAMLILCSGGGDAFLFQVHGASFRRWIGFCADSR